MREFHTQLRGAFFNNIEGPYTILRVFIYVRHQRFSKVWSIWLTNFSLLQGVRAERPTTRDGRSIWLIIKEVTYSKFLLYINFEYIFKSMWKVLSDSWKYFNYKNHQKFSDKIWNLSQKPSVLGSREDFSWKLQRT